MAWFSELIDLETYTGKAVTDIPKAEMALGMATGMIQSFTGQTIFFVEDDSVTVRPRGSTVFLPEVPVTAVSDVTVDAEPLVVDSGYTVDLSAGLLRLSSCADAVTVTYSHGYVSVPFPVRLACLKIAEQIMSGGSSGAVRSESVGTYSVTYDTDGASSSDSWQDLVRPYKLAAFA